MKVRKPVRYLLSLIIILIGWHLLFEGFVKLMDPGWSSASYLQNASGPLASLFKGMAASPNILKIIDIVNIYGQLVIGLLLMLGLWTRYAAIGGGLLLLTYYLANPPFTATAIGYSIEGHYMIVNKNLIEAVVLVFIALIPGDWHFGLQNLLMKRWLKLSRFRPGDNLSAEPEIISSNRRELIRNLFFLPFAAGFIISALKTKKTGINAISGATSIEENLITDEMPGNAESVYNANEPVGMAKGIFPGRVSWVWNPDATNPDCTNTTSGTGMIDENDDAWFMDKNNNQDMIDQMLIAGLASISGKQDPEKAWDAIFRFHNKKRGKGSVTYKEGERILIKTNRTSASAGVSPDLERLDVPVGLCCETSPQIVLSILRQLILVAGIPQEVIYVGDTMREVYKDEYDKYYSEFPGVNYLSATGNAFGRYHTKETSEECIFYSDKQSVMTRSGGADKFYDALEGAEYLISLAAMKGHNAAGISLCTKNHFGSQSRPSAIHLHQGLVARRPLGYGLYRVLVDLMSNKHTGGKNLFYILDALWTGANWNGIPLKFLMPPFNNHWSSSLLLSLDPVAIESVAFDFLREEFSRPEHSVNHISASGVDDYLHQAADSKNWPEDIIYAPDGDDQPIESLGVHEHWNNAVDKKYSRNLGTGKGIELVKIFQS